MTTGDGLRDLREQEAIVIVLSLCDRTCAMAMPWAEAGYECWCIDLQHETGVHRDGNIVRVGGDLRRWLPPRSEYRIAFAFPPCTDLAVSGARWFKDKGLAGLGAAIDLVERCRDVLAWCDCPWMLENPIGTLATYWRESDHKFDPYEYAGYLEDPKQDAYTKRTCLWTGGGFVMPETKPVLPIHGSMMHRLPPSEERANLRSVTPGGFARAVFEANHQAVLTD